MNSSRAKARFALTAVAILLMCGGCLEQEDNITVTPTGAASLEVKLSGELQHLRDPVLLPSDSEWSVLERTLDTTGKEPTLTLRATATVPYGSPLPPSFVPRTSPDFELSLHFPGQVTMRAEGNRTYYTFRRTYEARRFQAFDFSDIPSMWDRDLETRVLDTGLINASQQDRKQYLEQLSAAYGYRYLRFFWEALAALVRADALSDTAMQRLTDGASEYLEATLTPELVFAVMQRDEAKIQSAIDSLGAVIDQHFKEVITQVDHLNDTVSGQYERAYARAQREYDITQKLDGFQYTVNLVMPGTIISTNGVMDPKEPTKVFWWFNGAKLHDADLPMYAVSVVIR